MRKPLFFLALSTLVGISYADSSYLFRSHPDKFIPDDIDTTIKDNVKKALQGGPNKRNYDNIDVEVNTGNITLRGTVQTQQDYRNVMERVGDVRGVRDIDNQIQVLQKNTK